MFGKLSSCEFIDQHIILSPPTFQQPFDLPQLGRVVQLSEILSLLCQILALDCRISLVLHDFGRSVVKGWDHRCEVDILFELADAEFGEVCCLLRHADIAFWNLLSLSCPVAPW